MVEQAIHSSFLSAGKVDPENGGPAAMVTFGASASASGKPKFLDLALNALIKNQGG
jgi:hypothetical protein